MEVTVTSLVVGSLASFRSRVSQATSGINVPDNPLAALFGDLWQRRLSECMSDEKYNEINFLTPARYQFDRARIVSWGGVWFPWP
jgi:hypothetical protein